MKNFLLLLLFASFLVSGKANSQVNFESIEEYERLKNFYDRDEAFINYVYCEDKGILWGGGENCSNWLMTQPLRMAYTISSLNKRDIQAVVDFVTKDMIDYYVKYDTRFNKFNKDLELRLKKLNIEFVTGDTGRMIARAHSPREGDNTIIVNIDKWEDLNNYQRVWLMMHEWGHEVFGMKHGDNKLMYPIMPEEQLLMTAEFDEEVASEIYNRVYNMNLQDGVSNDRASLRASNAYNRYVNNSKRAQEEKFGDRMSSNNYDIEQFSSKVPIALNVFFDAAVDFFDFLISKHTVTIKRHNVYINDKINTSLPKRTVITIYADTTNPFDEVELFELRRYGNNWLNSR